MLPSVSSKTSLVEIFLSVTSCEAPSIFCTSSSDFRQRRFPTTLPPPKLIFAGLALFQERVPQLLFLHRSSQSRNAAWVQQGPCLLLLHTRGTCWELCNGLWKSNSFLGIPASPPSQRPGLGPLYNQVVWSCLLQVSRLGTDSADLNFIQTCITSGAVTWL